MTTEPVKPVAFECGCRSCKLWRLQDLHAKTLADHEAAMAELSADRDCWRDQAEDRIKDWEHEHDQLSTLQTRLSALADGWEGDMWKYRSKEKNAPIPESYMLNKGHADMLETCINQLKAIASTATDGDEGEGS